MKIINILYSLHEAAEKQVFCYEIYFGGSSLLDRKLHSLTTRTRDVAIASAISFTVFVYIFFVINVTFIFVFVTSVFKNIKKHNHKQEFSYIETIIFTLLQQNFLVF